MDRQCRDSFAQYTRAVAAHGAESAEVREVLERNEGDKDFSRLVRLADVAFAAYDRGVGKSKRRGEALTCS